MWNVKAYHRFSCMAAACPDSCCKDWAVDVDSQSAAAYQALPGPLGDRLRQVLVPEEEGYTMTLEQGRCPMWRQDGLCRIQAQLGHDALCQVCRQYPRLIKACPEGSWHGLDMACPEAARLLFACPGEENAPKHADDPAMSLLFDSRRQILSLLENTAYPLPRALTALLLYAHQVQDALYGEPLPALDPESLLQAVPDFGIAGSPEKLTAFFAGLEIMSDVWRERLKNPAPGSWEALRPFAIYLTQRHWLESADDLDVAARGKLIAAGCLLVQYLGGDPVETARLFSREVESDPDNVEAILEGAYTSPALTDANLLALMKN